MKIRFAYLLKLALALLALYFVSTKVNLLHLKFYFKSFPAPNLGYCILWLFLSQIISALRMRLYFKSKNILCTKFNAISLYFTGMFYNLVLPGGISGDAYKIYLLAKTTSLTKLAALKLAISERASGLFALSIYLLLLLSFSNHVMLAKKGLVLITLAIIISLSYFTITQQMLNEQLTVTFTASFLSFLVQGCSLLSATSILTALTTLPFSNPDIINYLIIFMISSIIAIIPISIGGAGLRELTFLYGSKSCGLDPEIGVAFSIIYFVINIIVSLCGVIFNTDKVTLEQR